MCIAHSIWKVRHWKILTASLKYKKDIFFFCGGSNCSSIEEAAAFGTTFQSARKVRQMKASTIAPKQ